MKWGVKMFICACSDIGKIRNINQDSYCYFDDNLLPLFVVADGMGGHNAGEVASKLAIDMIKENYLKEKNNILQGTLDIPKFINFTLKNANDKIFKEARENISYSGMGTTITLGIIYDRKLYIGHIGDSRAYIYKNNVLLQLTQDHSLVAELVRNGSITNEEAINHPQKNVITRALGTEETVKIDIISKELDPDDILIFCTDGLTNMLSDLEISNILSGCNDIKDACCLLTNTANERGGLDNTTVMIVKIS